MSNDNITEFKRWLNQAEDRYFVLPLLSIQAMSGRGY